MSMTSIDTPSPSPSTTTTTSHFPATSTTSSTSTSSSSSSSPLPESNRLEAYAARNLAESKEIDNFLVLEMLIHALLTALPNRESVFNRVAHYVIETFADTKRDLEPIINEMVQRPHAFTISKEGDTVRLPFVKWLILALQHIYQSYKDGDIDKHVNGVLLVITTLIHLVPRYPMASEVLNEIVKSEFGDMRHDRYVIIGVDTIGRDSSFPSCTSRTLYKIRYNGITELSASSASYTASTTPPTLSSTSAPISSSTSIPIGTYKGWSTHPDG